MLQYYKNQTAQIKQAHMCMYPHILQTFELVI